MKSIVTIHDVMPHTMQQTCELIDLCTEAGINNPALLVVPGKAWSSADIRQLKDWQSSGKLIVAHGWAHECNHISSSWHKLHSFFISRNVAEHLSLDEDEVSDLMDRSGNWFVENGFVHPEVYVPPAWALGKISMRTLSNKPYKIIETISGIIFPQIQRKKLLPLVGFEADTNFRATSLKIFNSMSMGLNMGRVIRISLHPQDHHLKLESDLRRYLNLCQSHFTYSDLLNEINR